MGAACHQLQLACGAHGLAAPPFAQPDEAAADEPACVMPGAHGFAAPGLADADAAGAAPAELLAPPDPAGPLQAVSALSDINTPERATASEAELDFFMAVGSR